MVHEEGRQQRQDVGRRTFGNKYPAAFVKALIFQDLDPRGNLSELEPCTWSLRGARVNSSLSLEACLANPSITFAGWK